MTSLAVEDAGPQVPSALAQSASAAVSSRKMHLVDAAIDFMGGVAGGTASVYVGQPLDTVKVKLQTFPGLYRNAAHCFVETYTQQGIARGLYAGTVPSLLANISENAILFLSYGFCQKGVAFLSGKTDTSQLSVFQNALAGGSAAFFSSLVLCPTELIKCKQQAMLEMRSTGKLKAELQGKIGPWYLTRQILREDGVPGMFRGLIPTFAREMPGYFFFFGGYEICRYLLTPPGKTKEELGPLRTMACGGMGGVSLWIAVFPADVIKSRAQVMVSNGPEKGFIRMFVSIFRKEGFLALYKGLGPTLLRTVPATGALFLAYETTKKTFHGLYYKNAEPNS